MPRMLETPLVISRANHFRISRVELDVEAPSCLIKIKRSYKDGETITLVDTISHLIVGDTMMAAMQTLTTGLTMYKELENLVYAALIADGVIPADAVDVEIELETIVIGPLMTPATA